jgi:hypothetical protein
MKRISTLFMLLAMGTVLFAAQISQQQAMEQARSFINKMKSGDRMLTRAQLNVGLQSALPDQQLIYAFNVEGGGFVIASGDDRTLPVLGYSLTGSIDAADMPDNMRSWLQSYVEQIASLTTPKGTTQNVEDSSLPAVEPLLKTTWYQNNPYNIYTPIYSEEGSEEAWRGKKTPTGCVATAMAQVMYYHQWPQEPTPVIPEYTFEYKEGESCTRPELPSTTFKWDQMLLNYDSINPGTEEQQKAVAKLMLYCGQALKTNYTPDDSGTQHEYVATVLRRFFGYSKSIQSINRSDYTIQGWRDVLWNELNNKRPIVFGALTIDGGHEFVIDGYDGKGMFHVNWGWAGKDDGYFAINVLNPNNNTSTGSASSTRLGFVFNQSAIIGIEKSTGSEVEIPEPESRIFLFMDPYIRQIIQYNSHVDSMCVQPMYICYENPYGHFYIGLGLKNNNGTCTPIMEKTEPTTVWCNLSPKVTFAIEDLNLEDGSYKLWPIAKNADIENAEWQIIGNNKQFFTVEVKDSKATVTVPYQLRIVDAYFTNADAAPMVESNLAVIVENPSEEEINTIVKVSAGNEFYGNYEDELKSYPWNIELNPGERDTLNFTLMIRTDDSFLVKLRDYSGFFTHDEKYVPIPNKTKAYDFQILDYRIEYLEPEQLTNCSITIKNNDDRDYGDPYQFEFGILTNYEVVDVYKRTVDISIHSGETVVIDGDDNYFNKLPFEHEDNNNPGDIRVTLKSTYKSDSVISTLLDITVKYGTVVTPEGVTAIEGIRMMDDNRNTPYYDLQGRQLNGKPAKKGIYINQGRKIVNK